MRRSKNDNMACSGAGGGPGAGAGAGRSAACGGAAATWPCTVAATRFVFFNAPPLPLTPPRFRLLPGRRPPPPPTADKLFAAAGPRRLTGWRLRPRRGTLCSNQPVTPSANSQMPTSRSVAWHAPLLQRLRGCLLHDRGRGQGRRAADSSQTASAGSDRRRPCSDLFVHGCGFQRRGHAPPTAPHGPSARPPAGSCCALARRSGTPLPPILGRPG